MKTVITNEVVQEALCALEKVIRIPSVLEEDLETPFGKPIQSVLEEVLALAETLGFKTFLDHKGYYGYAEVGEGEELLGILCHLDVVPAGDLSQWQTPPFELTQKESYLYGRGVQDDKGPTIATLFAVVALMRAGVSFNKRVRFIFGTDEETLWRCMNRYNSHEEIPTLGFAPDSSFPLTFAEKGLLQVKFHGKGDDTLQVAFGEAFNVVPGKVTYQGKWEGALKTGLEELGYPYTEDSRGITVQGISKHSKDAAEGLNAIVRFAEALSLTKRSPVLDFVRQEVGYETTLAHLFGDLNDGVSGDLSFNLAKMTITPEKTELGIDIRFPVLADKDMIVEHLRTVAEKYGLTYEEFDYVAPLYVPKDSPLVQTLLSVYREMTGDMREPMVSGGATFARMLPNGVAFGACFPDTPQTEHQENECMPLADFGRMMSIYAEAVYRLTR